MGTGSGIGDLAAHIRSSLNSQVMFSNPACISTYIDTVRRQSVVYSAQASRNKVVVKLSQTGCSTSTTGVRQGSQEDPVRRRRRRRLHEGLPGGPGKGMGTAKVQLPCQPALQLRPATYGGISGLIWLAAGLRCHSSCSASVLYMVTLHKPQPKPSKVAQPCFLFIQVTDA